MKRNVLLVDDDATFRRSVRFLFKGESYSFLEAATAEEAIGSLDSSPETRIILLDLALGDHGGTAVLDHIKDRSGDYRVIVLTGHQELLQAEQAGEYQVFNYLPKAESRSPQALRFSLNQAFRELEHTHLDRKNRFLREVQERVTANREMSETLDFICESVRSTVGAFTCHIRVYDFSRGDYHLQGFAGAQASMRSVFERPRAKGDLFSGSVVASRKSAVYDDLQRMPEFLKFAEKALAGKGASPEEKIYWRGVRSAYIVPISTGVFDDAVDAVLNVSSEALRYFEPEQCSLVEEFVTQAALTIAKDWLQRRREEIHHDYSEITRMLGEMSDSLRGSEALTPIYEVATRGIAKIVNPEVVSLFVYNEAKGRLENVAEFRGGESMVATEESYTRGQGLTGSVLKEEGPIQLPTPGDPTRKGPADDPRLDPQEVEICLQKIPSGILEHYLGVPIRMGGKVRGVLRAINKKSKYYDKVSAKGNPLCLLARGFSADCRNAMEITASHLAVAIRNAELLREKEQQIIQVRTLGNVGRSVNAALDIRELQTATIKEMADVMQSEICMLFLWDGEDRVVLKESFGMPPIPDAFYRFGDHLTGRVAETHESCLVARSDRQDGKYDREIHAFLRWKHGAQKNIESLMIVPIVAKGTTLGVMKVINKVGDHPQYGERDLEVFRTFADYVGVAIENAWIYTDLSQLVSAVAHEINNTSGVIPANVEKLRSRLSQPSEAMTRALGRIEDAASQATEFANEIAGFSANRTGKKTPLDVNEVVRKAVGALTLARRRGVKKIELKQDLSREPLICEIFETPFYQIVRNIVINAFQALEDRDGGFVRVSSVRGAGELVGFALIRFDDNGPGIKAEHRGKIFDADFTTKRRGNGVGLWLVRTQLRRVGGRVEVESEPGAGASFVLRVPLAR